MRSGGNFRIRATGLNASIPVSLQLYYLHTKTVIVAVVARIRYQAVPIAAACQDPLSDVKVTTRVTTQSVPRITGRTGLVVTRRSRSRFSKNGYQNITLKQRTCFANDKYWAWGYLNFVG